MIGSVHGCVSCPVVVRPWEPESLSRPQHPLPSHSHPQSHPYSLPQRSSSVHPLPQSATPDDKRHGSSRSPQRHVHDQTHGKQTEADEKEISSNKSSSPEKEKLAISSPEKTQSANGSPKKGDFVLGSREFAEQYEKLLGPKPSGISNVKTSSQGAHSFESHSPGDYRTSQFSTGVYHVESSESKAEPGVSSPKLVDKEGQQPLDHKSAQGSDASRQVLPKDFTSRESSSAPVRLPDSANIRKILSPTPLPSIQDRKMLTRELSQEVPCVPFLTSRRPSKGLPSISNPKLHPMKKHAAPSRSGHSLRKERKQQIGKKRSEMAQGLEPASDSNLKVKHGGIEEPGQRDSQLTSTSGKISQISPRASASEITNVILPQASKGSVSSFQKKIDVASQLAQTNISPTRPSQDAPTPQSLDSSLWSVGKIGVAPEVDALTTAAAAADLKKVKSLLAEGVNVNAVNTFGRTAIQVMSVDNTELAEVLLKAGADPNMQDKGRRAASSTFRTIAHDVADSGNTDMLRCLLRHGADVNLQDKWGNTPLHLAAKGGHLASVRLLRRGSSLYQTNLVSKTPMRLLEETGNAEIKQWVELKKSTVSHLKTLSVLVVRQNLGPGGLRRWTNYAPNEIQELGTDWLKIWDRRTVEELWSQVLLQIKGSQPHRQASTSTILSSQLHSAEARSATGRRHGNGSGHPLLPGMSAGKQMTDFLTLRDLIPRRLSTGENTSLEVHNTSSGQSIDDVSLGAHATSSLASESGSLFETNLSSIEASQSADDVSLPSFDHSL